MGESKPRLPGDTPEIPVVLVVVSAIGSDFGLMLARKSRAARQTGAASRA